MFKKFIAWLQRPRLMTARNRDLMLREHRQKVQELHDRTRLSAR